MCRMVEILISSRKWQDELHHKEGTAVNLEVSQVLKSKIHSKYFHSLVKSGIKDLDRLNLLAEFHVVN